MIKFWVGIAAETETKAKVVKILKQYNADEVSTLMTEIWNFYNERDRRNNSILFNMMSGRDGDNMNITFGMVEGTWDGSDSA